MKNISITLIFLISISIFSQEKKKIFNPELKKYVLQCEYIGRTIIDKNVSSDLDKWYDGIDKEKAILKIKQLESDINNSKLDVTYHLIMMNESPLIYTYHFYNKETKTKFGQLFIQFKDRENDLVDYVKLVTKSRMEEIDAELENKLNTEPSVPIPPPPPPPPIEKKKKGN